MKKNIPFEFIHLPQSEDLGPQGRSYTLTEKVISFKGKKVLALETAASDISFCDSSHACQLRTFTVKGYIDKWKFHNTPEGLPVSLIRTILNDEEKIQLREHIRSNFNVENIVI